MTTSGRSLFVLWLAVGVVLGALLDRAGMLRYATLDPHCIGMGQNQEIIALMRALR